MGEDCKNHPGEEQTGEWKKGNNKLKSHSEIEPNSNKADNKWTKLNQLLFMSVRLIHIWSLVTHELHIHTANNDADGDQVWTQSWSLEIAGFNREKLRFKIPLWKALWKNSTIP